MTPDTLQYYAPCEKHGLWHDTARECYYCLVEAVKLPELPD